MKTYIFADCSMTNIIIKQVLGKYLFNVPFSMIPNKENSRRMIKSFHTPIKIIINTLNFLGIK